MRRQCPWCKMQMADNADVCPHCTRSTSEYWQESYERRIPKMPQAGTLPCHACGAWIPAYLIGDSRRGDQPGFCPSCSQTCDTAYWDELLSKPRRCNCGHGTCYTCRAQGGQWVGWIWNRQWVQCQYCKGSGKCSACHGTFVIQPGG